MTVQNKLETMYRMRQSGTTLDQVGNRFGITREGVRKLLTGHFGSTRVKNLLTVTELTRLTNCGYSYIGKLKRRGVIQPAMVVGHGRTLWKPETIATIIMYLDRHVCPMCQGPVPSNRQVYCSRECYLEAHRYKNQPEEVKRRHNERVKRWLNENPERARRLQQRKQLSQRLNSF
jgi:hypothetical protein